MADWVFILWITVGSGSTVASRVTEAQCRAAVTEINDTVDPIMGYCFGPAGERVRTQNIRDRVSARSKLDPAKPEAPKVSRGTAL